MKNFYYENMAIKTAGIVLLLNAAAIIFISALDTGFNTLGNIIFVIETILGIGILAGSSIAVMLTKYRAYFGLLFSFVFYLMIIGDLFSFVFSSLYCLGLLGLLIGAPKKKRYIFLCSIFYFIFPNFPVGVFKFVY